MSDEIERLVEARARAGYDAGNGPGAYDRLSAVARDILCEPYRAAVNGALALGLPAETLAGLVSGRLVAVPRHKLREVEEIVSRLLVDGREG